MIKIHRAKTTEKDIIYTFLVSDLQICLLLQPKLGNRAFLSSGDVWGPEVSVSDVPLNVLESILKGIFDL